MNASNSFISHCIIFIKKINIKKFCFLLYFDNIFYKIKYFPRKDYYLPVKSWHLIFLTGFFLYFIIINYLSTFIYSAIFCQICLPLLGYNFLIFPSHTRLLFFQICFPLLSYNLSYSSSTTRLLEGLISYHIILICHACLRCSILF